MQVWDNMLKTSPSHKRSQDDIKLVSLSLSLFYRTVVCITSRGSDND